MLLQPSVGTQYADNTQREAAEVAASELWEALENAAGGRRLEPHNPRLVPAIGKKLNKILRKPGVAQSPLRP